MKNIGGAMAPPCYTNTPPKWTRRLYKISWYKL